MNHVAAQDLLVHFVDGELEPDRERELREHISDCPECATWVTTYEALSVELSHREQVPASHPERHEIVSFALEAHSLGEFDHARIARHVRECSSCASEVGMVEASVEESTYGIEGEPDQASLVPGLSRPSGIGLAAMLLLFLGVLFVTQLPNAAPSDVTLEGDRLVGQETISASRSINLQHTAVASGAALTLESQSVAFGDGFSIEDSAALVVVTDTVLEDS